MIHLKGFLSLDIRQKKDKTINTGYRRIGFMVSEGFNKDDNNEYYESFRGLNEAVVSELETRFKHEVVLSTSDSNVKEELSWLESDQAKKFKETAAKKRNIPIEEIDWISHDGKHWETTSYRVHRRVLGYIVDNIAEDTGKKEEEIYNLFFKAHFTGELLELGRLIDRAFGNLSFRVVSMMGGEMNSANQTLDYLKKQRIRIKKGEKDKN
jgi:hypothetical protein